MEEKLLKHEDEEMDAGKRRKDGSWKKRVSAKVVLEQSARGVIHMAQFGVSYCIMLLFMYSNGKETYTMFISLSRSTAEYLRLIACRIHHNFDFVRHFCWLRLIHQGHAVFAR